MTIVTNDNAFFSYFQADMFKMKIEKIIEKTTVTIVTIVTACVRWFEFSLHQTRPILLLLMVAIAPSLGKNNFLGRAQILLGYVGK